MKASRNGDKRQVCKSSDLKDAAERAVPEVPDVDDVVARVLEVLERGIDPGADALVRRVVPQLFQIDAFFLFVGRARPSRGNPAPFRRVRSQIRRRVAPSISRSKSTRQ